MTEKKLRILVIGEAMEDRYIIGHVHRLSAEAPIPVVDVDKKIIFPGGAGNVAANVQSLGGEAVPIYQPDYRMPIKHRLMVSDHQLARWDEFDSASPLTDHQLDMAELYMKDVDGVILSDYGKGMFTGPTIKRLATLAGNLPTFIDTKQDPFWFLPFANAWHFPNLKEYRQFCMAYEDLENVVLKRGSEGLQFGDHKVPAKARKIRSVNGAGDTVIAAFALYYLLNGQVDVALEAAAKAAGLACEQPYTTAVRKEWMVYGSEPVLTV